MNKNKYIFTFCIEYFDIDNCERILEISSFDNNKLKRLKNKLLNEISIIQKEIKEKNKDIEYYIKEIKCNKKSIIKKCIKKKKNIIRILEVDLNLIKIRILRTKMLLN